MISICKRDDDDDDDEYSTVYPELGLEQFDPPRLNVLDVCTQLRIVLLQLSLNLSNHEHACITTQSHQNLRRRLQMLW